MDKKQRNAIAGFRTRWSNFEHLIKLLGISSVMPGILASCLIRPEPNRRPCCFLLMSLETAPRRKPPLPQLPTYDSIGSGVQLQHLPWVVARAPVGDRLLGQEFRSPS